MARYANLPRIQLTLLDGQLVDPITRPPGESVLIIGPAPDGPTDRVVQVQSLAAIERLYGPMTYNSQYTGPYGETVGNAGNDLLKGLREVARGGAQNIQLLRIGGEKATATHTNAHTSATGTITFSAVYPGRIYNSVSVAFTSGATSGKVVITQPTIKGGVLTIAYSLGASGITVQQVIDKINSNLGNRTVVAARGTISATALARNLTGTVTLAGGLDGTSTDELSGSLVGYYNDLVEEDTGVFARLEGHEADVVYLAGIYADDQVDAGDSTKSAGKALSEFIAGQIDSYPMLGVVGIRPLTDYSTPAKIRTYYTELMDTTSGTRSGYSQTRINPGYFMNGGYSYANADIESVVDGGAYIQTVVGDVNFVDPDLGPYTDNWAGVYAGTLATLAPQRAATNLAILGIRGAPWKFTQEQLDNLAGGVGKNEAAGLPGGGAYVTLREWSGRGIRITSDVTSASRDSDFADLQLLRIATTVQKGIRFLAFPFLGSPNDVPTRISLETSIKSFLDRLAEAGALRGGEGIGYILTVGGQPLDQTIGRLQIDCTLFPASQIKQIDVRVKLGGR